MSIEEFRKLALQEGILKEALRNAGETTFKALRKMKITRFELSVTYKPMFGLPLTVPLMRIDEIVLRLEK
jgi:hypothetical protein